jgi:hypothetical protein
VPIIIQPPTHPSVSQTIHLQTYSPVHLLMYFSFLSSQLVFVSFSLRISDTKLHNTAKIVTNNDPMWYPTSRLIKSIIYHAIRKYGIQPYRNNFLKLSLDALHHNTMYTLIWTLQHSHIILPYKSATRSPYYMKNNAVGHYTKDTQIQLCEFCMVARNFQVACTFTENLWVSALWTAIYCTYFISHMTCSCYLHQQYSKQCAKI